MNEFVPPFPQPREDWIKATDALKHRLSDLPVLWPENAFEMQFPGGALLNYGGFVANCPDAIEHIFSTHLHHYKKHTFIEQKTLAPLLGSELLDIPQSLITLNAVADYRPVIEQAIADYQQRWTRFQPQEKIALLPELQKLTAEIICRIFFANRLAANQTNTLINACSDYQQSLENMHITALIDLTSWLPFRSGKNQLAKAAKSIHQLLDELIAQELKSNHNHSLLSYLANHPTNPATPLKLRNQFIMLFLTGHLMVTHLLGWAWYLISQCPEVEKRLHQELDNVLINGSLNDVDISKLVYCQAILEETLRLYPPVPVLSLEAQKTARLRKKEIPVGGLLVVIPSLLQRHKKYWDKPDHFIPERFLPEAQTAPNPFCHLPFSDHPFAALLKSFGFLEATLCLAGLAAKFRFSEPPGQKIEWESGLTVRPKEGLKMLITPR